MRTTIDLPDALVRAARVRAAERDETLKDLFARALSKELALEPRRTRRTLPLVGSRRPGASAATPEDLEGLLTDDDADRLP